MKKEIYAFLTCLMVFSACDKPVMDGHDRTLGISLHQCVNPSFAGNRITICMDSVVSDSRCPTYAMCIWQGTAIARFSLHAAGESYPFTLSTLPLPGLFSRDTILSGYRFEFRDMDPYPGTVAYPVPDNKIRAILQVTKL